jgi:hypothetical protein
MYYNIKTEEIITRLPEYHIFAGSSHLSEPVADGCSTGEFHLWGNEYHAAEGFLPFEEARPEYDQATQVLTAGEIVVAADGKSASRTWVIIEKNEEELAADLARAKEERKAGVMSLRTQKELGGFVFGGVRYDTKSSLLQNINGMLTRILLTDELPEGFQGWIAEDNTIVQMTVEEFKDFALTACDYIATLYAVARYHKDSIDALTALQEVQDYDIEAGW